jgi:Phytochelatin synthase
MIGPLLLTLALGQLQPLPPNLIPLDSDEGRALLVRSKASRAFYPLASQFVTQDTTSFCGVASSVMVLNAMPSEAPVAKPWAPFRLFTQDNVFGEGELKAASVKKGGLTLEQTAFLLRENHVDAVAVHAADSSEDEFRQKASASLGQPGHHVLVDFLRSELHQDTGAHWSPLGAYDDQSDRFLVLDVARFRYPPY